MNVMGLPIYTQFVSITEIPKYVPINLPAAKPYLLANLQEGLRKLHQENSFLGTTGEQGQFCMELHIYCSSMYPDPAPQPV